MCNNHVGQGGGQPHTHGDPFGPGCLYSAANYATLSAHPPIIAVARDGPFIFGRYLSASAPGFSTNPLDDCGGHKHDSYGYHYHTVRACVRCVCAVKHARPSPHHSPLL